MKYLVLVVVVLLVLWLAKSSRGKVGSSAKRPDQAEAAAGSAAARALEGEMMPACAHCGLHLPRSEALAGRGGVFCSEAHRALAEAKDGPA